MGWEDRDYNYSGRSGAMPFFARILGGSIPFFRVFGIDVRIHATLLWFIGLTIAIWPLTHQGVYAHDVQNAATACAILFLSVLLHEFGHCFACRFMGGHADQIMMSPLGGLAFVSPPHRPWPTFVTVACGPLTNVLICALAVFGIFLFTGKGDYVSYNPFHFVVYSYSGVVYYLHWVFLINYALMLFNVCLPMFPFDGGRMVQCVLWPRLGYRRSMDIACVTGMAAAPVLALYGLYVGEILLVFIAVIGFMQCYQNRLNLRHEGDAGPEFFVENHRDDNTRRRRLSKRTMRRAQKIAAEEQAEQARIDGILAKVSAQGMHSLNWAERRALKKATQRQRDRDLETAKMRNF